MRWICLALPLLLGGCGTLTPALIGAGVSLVGMANQDYLQRHLKVTDTPACPVVQSPNGNLPAGH